MVAAGVLSHRCTVERREVLENTRGSARGGYLPVPGLIRISCGYREVGLKEIALGNGAQGVIDGVVFVRDCRAARTIVNGDRLVLDGIGYAVVSAGLPDRRLGTIPLQVKKGVG